MLGGQPIVPFARPAAIPPIADSEYADSTMSNFLDIVLKITKEAGEVLKDVPYVKVLSGIILQIIKIREVRTLARSTIAARLHY